MRAVVDTNVWVSGFLNPHGAPARLRLAYRQGQFVVVTSEPFLAELAEVLTRPKLTRKYQVSPSDVSDLLSVLRERATLVSISGTSAHCRDPKDDMVIETAIKGRAEVLVSGDADLGAHEVVEHLAGLGIRVMTVSQFLRVLPELD